MIFLLESRFNVPQIAGMMGFSVSTICRRITTLGLSVRAQYSNLSDVELDDIVNGIHQQHPTCGNVTMKGHLIAMGYNVQQITVITKNRSNWYCFAKTACDESAPILDA